MFTSKCRDSVEERSLLIERAEYPSVKMPVALIEIQPLALRIWNHWIVVGYTERYQGPPLAIISNALNSINLKYEAISVPQGSVRLVKKTQERKSSTCYLLITKEVTSSSPVPLKTRRVGERCTLNLSRAQTSSGWSGVGVKRSQLKNRPRQPLFKITRSSPKALVLLNSATLIFTHSIMKAH
ncbi:hypothetical protein TNCV_291421 [Trichonephila clavipes]|nr:hypothetical protein TNCV_291421 [Trichonephila clavipes]